MDKSEKTGIVKVYLSETDKVNGRALFEEIVYEARKAGIAGATVTRGIMSFGKSHAIHTMKIFALSDKLPVIIEIVDNIEKLDEFVKIINELMDKSKKGGLVTFQELEVIRYVSGEKS